MGHGEEGLEAKIWQSRDKKLLKFLSCFSGININYVDPQQHFLASHLSFLRMFLGSPCETNSRQALKKHLFICRFSSQLSSLGWGMIGLLMSFVTSLEPTNSLSLISWKLFLIKLTPLVPLAASLNCRTLPKGRLLPPPLHWINKSSEAKTFSYFRFLLSSLGKILFFHFRDQGEKSFLMSCQNSIKDSIHPLQL